MAEEQTAGGMPGAGTDGEMSAGAGAAGTPDQGEPGPAVSLEQVQAELERVRKALKEANASDATRRRQIEGFEAAEKARQLAAMSEMEKAQAVVKMTQEENTKLKQKVAETEKAHRERVIRYEVMLKASALGMVDPDVAWRLLDWGALEFAEDGSPKNVEKVLRELVKAKPYLVKATTVAPNINAGATGGGIDEKARAEEIRRRFRLG